jgi:hypothetical protein
MLLTVVVSSQRWGENGRFQQKGFRSPRILRPVRHLPRHVLQRSEARPARALKVGKKTLVLKSDAESWAKSLPELRTGGHEQASA